MTAQRIQVLRRQKVAGFFYRDIGAKACAATHAGAGNVVGFLVIEPDNGHDAHAVAVQLHGHTLGYLPRSMSGAMVALMAVAGVQQIDCNLEIERTAKGDCEIFVSVELGMGEP